MTILVFFNKTKGVKQLIVDNPFLLFWLIILSIGIYTLVSQSLSTLYWIMLGGAGLGWVINKFFLKIPENQLSGVDSNPRNSFKSIFIALVALIGIIIITIGAGVIFSNVSTLNTPVDLASYLDQSAEAFLGSSQEPIFSKEPWALFFAFGFYIPIVETLLYIEVLTFVMYIVTMVSKETLLGDTTRYGILKKPMFWLANSLVAIGMVFLHLTAKGVSDIPLALVFIFFMVTGVLAFVRIFKQRERETVLWLHIFNNSLAMAAKLSYLSIFVVWGLI